MGNNGSGTLTLNKNTGLPSLGITSPVANSYVNISNAASFTLNGTCSVNGNPVNITSPLTKSATCSASHWTLTLDVSALPDNDFTITYNHSDNSGNTTTASRTYKKDTIAPAVSFTSPIASTYINAASVSNFTATGTCSDNGQTVVISGDASGTAVCGSGTWTASLNFSAAAEGSVSVTATHSDIAGNAITDSRIFIKDTSAPVLAITSPAANSYVNAVNVSAFAINGTCSENSRNVVITGDSSATFTCTSGTWSGSLSFSAAPQGNLNISVTQNDTAGNVSTITRAFIKDTVLPTLAISSPTNGSYINASNVSSYTLNGTCSENGQTINLTGAATSTTSCSAGTWTKTLDLSAVSDGAISFTVTIADVAGNSVSSTVNLTKDVVLPSLSLSSFTGGQVIAGGSIAAITWTGSDNNTLPTTPISIDYSTNSGTSWSSVATSIANSGSYSWMTPVITSGTVRFKVTIKDAAGNTRSVTSTSDFAINSTSPTISLTSLTGGQYLSGGSTQAITWTANGAYLGATPIKIESSSDSGATWTTIIAATANTRTYSWSIPTVDATSYRVRVTATDQSNLSTSSASTSNLTIDNTDPTLTLNKPVSTDILAGASTYYINWTASDTNFGSTPIKFEYSTNSGTSWTTIAASTANAGNYAWTVPSLNSSNVTVRATATDLANRTKQVVSAAFVVDSTPPTAPVAILSSAAVTNSTAVSLNVTCIADYAKVLITESAIAPLITDPAWQTCASSMSFTIATGDGNHAIKIWSKDLAGNISTAPSSITVLLDQTAPLLTVANPPSAPGNSASGSASWTLTEANVSSGTNFTVELYNGSSWSTIGTKVALAGANNNQAYSMTGFSLPNVDTVGAKIRVTVTDAAGNQSQNTSGAFVIESTLPTVSAFTISQSASTTVQNVQVNLSASSLVSKISYFCIKMNTTTAPSASDSCWRSVSASPPGLTPAKSLSLNNYYYQLGFTTGTYSLYGFVKNDTGLISALSNSGSGTSGVDDASIIYTSPSPPTLLNIIAANNDAPTNPTQLSDYAVAANGSVYIKWKASDSNLGSTPISIYYTKDDKSYTLIASNLTNGSNGACTPDSGSTTLDDGNTGCYVWTGGAPGTYFRIKVTATNAGDISTANVSTSLNSGNIQILAGNTDTGVNSSAASAILSIQKNNNSPMMQQFVVMPNGTIIIIDQVNGLMKIDPANGKYQVLIPSTGTIGNEGDGGPVTSAKLYKPLKIAMDYQGNLYLWDNIRIRMINTQSNPWTINTIIGGGSLYTDGITATNLLLAPPTMSTPNTSALFQVRPNGKIYFLANYFGYTLNTSTPPYIWVYDPATQIVNRYLPSGNGYYGNSSGDISIYSLVWLGLSFDTSSSSTLSAYVKLNTGGGGSADTRLDPISYQVITPIPTINTTNTSSLMSGMDGNIYMVGFGLPIKKYNNGTGVFNDLIGASGSGYCPDGTLASACKLSLYDLFIDANGKAYWNDWGSIRTLDQNNKVLTIAGQNLFYGDGLAANSARIGYINRLLMKSTGELVFLDGLDGRIRQLNDDQTMSTLAGNGINITPDTTNPANTQGIMVDNYVDTASIGITSTDDIVYNRGKMIAKLSSSTGKWVDITGGGATSYTTGDGGVVKFDSSYFPKVLGILGNSVIASAGSWCGNYCNTLIKSYDLTTGVQSNFAGILGSHGNGWPTDGQSLVTNFVPHVTNLGPFIYDSTVSLWYTGDGNRVRTMSATGAMATLFADAGVSNITGITLSRNSGSLIVYYCGDGKLRKWSQSTSIATALSWPITTMSCTNALTIHPTNGSLIFGFSQNSLFGIGRYGNP